MSLVQRATLHFSLLSLRVLLLFLLDLFSLLLSFSSLSLFLFYLFLSLFVVVSSFCEGRSPRGGETAESWWARDQTAQLADREALQRNAWKAKWPSRGDDWSERPPGRIECSWRPIQGSAKRKAARHRSMVRERDTALSPSSQNKANSFALRLLHITRPIPHANLSRHRNVYINIYMCLVGVRGCSV